MFNEVSLFLESIISVSGESLPDTALKVSKYGVFSGLYFPVFGLTTGKYGPEKSPYLDTFHAVGASVLNGK